MAGHTEIERVRTLLKKRLAGLENKADILKAVELKALYAEIPMLKPEQRGGFGKEINALRAELEAVVADLVRTVSSHAPLTMWATRESLRRIRNANLPTDDDLLAKVYGSTDFATGVRSFLAKERPTWVGH